MAPRKENRESNDNKLLLSPQLANFKDGSKPMGIAPFLKLASEAKKSGNIARFNQMKDAWPVLLECYTIFAMRARRTYFDRRQAEATIKGDYALALRLCRVNYGVTLEDMEVGSSEWMKWVKVAISQNFDCTPSEEDNRREHWADVMVRARSLRAIHLRKLYQEAKIIGDSAKAVVLLQAMRDRLQDGSDECHKWIEKAKDQLERSREWKKVLAETLRHNLSAEVNLKSKSADVVDRARLLRKFHLSTLYHGVKSHDNVKAAELVQALREPLNEDSKEWRIWIEAANKYIPDDHDVQNLQANEKSFSEELREQCAIVEESICCSGRPHGWIDFWRERETIDHSEVDKAVQAIREMNNAYTGEQSVLTTDVSGQMECLSLSSPNREAIEATSIPVMEAF